MADDHETDRAWARYTEAFRRDVLPHLLSSACMVAIADEWTLETIDLRAATEMGLMLMLDKPLLVLVPKGEQPPAALRRAAREIVWDWHPDDEAAQDRLAEAMRRVTEGL